MRSVLDVVLHVLPVRQVGTVVKNKKEKDPSPDSNPFQPKKLSRYRDPLGNAIAEPHGNGSARCIQCTIIHPNIQVKVDKKTTKIEIFLWMAFVQKDKRLRMCAT